MFDLDGNRIVDMDDWNILAHDCLTGPDEARVDPTCRPADANGDSFIDLRDVAHFQNSY